MRGHHHPQADHRGRCAGVQDAVCSAAARPSVHAGIPYSPTPPHIIRRPNERGWNIPEARFYKAMTALGIDVVKEGGSLIFKKGGMKITAAEFRRLIINWIRENLTLEQIKKEILEAGKTALEKAADKKAKKLAKLINWLFDNCRGISAEECFEKAKKEFPDILTGLGEKVLKARIKKALKQIAEVGIHDPGAGTECAGQTAAPE